jgi:hypothetical protein
MVGSDYNKKIHSEIILNLIKKTKCRNLANCFNRSTFLLDLKYTTVKTKLTRGGTMPTWWIPLQDKYKEVFGSSPPIANASTSEEIAAQLEAKKMQTRFQYDMKLKQLDVQNVQQKEGAIEDRKDTRSKMEASQQSELISQRKNDGLPINFESQPEEGMQAFM